MLYPLTECIDDSVGIPEIPLPFSEWELVMGVQLERLGWARTGHWSKWRATGPPLMPQT